MGKEIFQRAEALLGTEAMERISEQRVIIFGTGGVGSWCAEALVRTGVRLLTIVDFDCVDVTNINRQLMATTQTVGQPKVEALRKRLLEINPDAEITALQKTFSEETADEFDLDKYDYIIDAIDSLKDKALLILKACETEARLFSSMGAALKLDSTKIQVAEFWKVKGDPLARALRNRFKKEKTFPRHKFQCVYSDEAGQKPTTNSQQLAKGSLVHITATFGMTLAGLIIQDIRRLVLLLVLMMTLGIHAQNTDQKRQDIDLDSPTFVPTVKVGKVLENGDSIQYMEMNNRSERAHV
jgi:tRNA A37 threonylcarbamoyladenosine dehydratase